MAYNRHYYSHGAEPFAYQWHGRIQFPARDASSLHGYVQTGATPDLQSKKTAVGLGGALALIGGVVAIAILAKK